MSASILSQLDGAQAFSCHVFPVTWLCYQSAKTAAFVHNLSPYTYFLFILIFVWFELVHRYRVFRRSCIVVIVSGGARNFQLGGCTPGVWGKSPVGPNSEAPVEGLGYQVLQRLNQFAEIVHRFWLQKRSKFKTVELTLYRKDRGVNWLHFAIQV